jgi:hypothetical protein
MKAADSYKMLYQLVNLDSAIYSFKWQFKLIREGNRLSRLIWMLLVRKTNASIKYSETPI